MSDAPGDDDDDDGYDESLPALECRAFAHLNATDLCCLVCVVSDSVEREELIDLLKARAET